MGSILGILFFISIVNFLWVHPGVGIAIFWAGIMFLGIAYIIGDLGLFGY